MARDKGFIRRQLKKLYQKPISINSLSFFFLNRDNEFFKLCFETKLYILRYLLYIGTLYRHISYIKNCLHICII